MRTRRLPPVPADAHIQDMTEQDQAPVIAWLTDPATHGGVAVERVDTHAAIVVLAGERAWKLKRAVRYPYLDFSTVERRRAACETELAVNRRTAPGLYDAVVPVTRGTGGLEPGGFELGGAGEVVDWVVAMRRFPAGALFDRMAAEGRLTVPLMRDLADRIAAFHADAALHREGGADAAMRAVVVENLEELRAHPGVFAPPAVERLERDSLATLDRLEPLMEARGREGRVVRGHGDLHLRNIVLLDGVPTLFDAIEFDEAMATVDVLYDLAFLLMDLEHRALRPLANALFNRWLERTGDVGGLALLPLFLSARAAIRAKIGATAAALRPEPDAAVERAEAGRYLDLALAAIAPPPPVLVAVGGLSGTGKTTLARAIAPRLGPVPGAVVLRSDAVRKALHGVAETERLPPEAYTQETTRTVYAHVVERAAATLAAGHAVVVDAVHARPEERAAVEAVAASAGAAFAGVWLEADSGTRVRRIAGRAPDASDATAEIALRQESYETGPLAWARVAAAAPAEMVAAGVLRTLDQLICVADAGSKAH